MIKYVWLASLGLFLGTAVTALADLDFQVALELMDDDEDGVIEFDIAGIGALATSPNPDDTQRKLTAEQEREAALQLAQRRVRSMARLETQVARTVQDRCFRDVHGVLRSVAVAAAWAASSAAA